MASALELVRALSRASQPVNAEHKSQLFNRGQRLQNIADKPPGSDTRDELKSEIAQLEEHLARVLRMEEELLRRTKETDALRKQMRHMRLASDSGELGKKLEKIQFLLGELTARLDSFARMKEHSEQRVHAIDKKIKQAAQPRRELEISLDKLEKKYDRVKKKGVSAERLQPIHERIQRLRDGLENREERIMPVRVERTTSSDGFIGRAAPPARFVTDKPPVKHEMLFQENASLQDEIELSNEPIVKIESFMSPPPQRKKSFVRKMFGR